MSKSIIAPSKYVQGKGELAKINEYTRNMGKSFLIISSSKE